VIQAQVHPSPVVTGEAAEGEYPVEALGPLVDGIDGDETSRCVTASPSCLSDRIDREVPTEVGRLGASRRSLSARARGSGQQGPQRSDGREPDLS
jgi:hypothetical protein